MIITKDMSDEEIANAVQEVIDTEKIILPTELRKFAPLTKAEMIEEDAPPNPTMDIIRYSGFKIIEPPTYDSSKLKWYEKLWYKIKGVF